MNNDIELKNKFKKINNDKLYNNHNYFCNNSKGHFHNDNTISNKNKYEDSDDGNNVLWNTYNIENDLEYGKYDNNDNDSDIAIFINADIEDTNSKLKNTCNANNANISIKNSKRFSGKTDFYDLYNDIYNDNSTDNNSNNDSSDDDNDDTNSINEVHNYKVYIDSRGTIERGDRKKIENDYNNCNFDGNTNDDDNKSNPCNRYNKNNKVKCFVDSHSSGNGGNGETENKNDYNSDFGYCLDNENEKNIE
eukprot:Pgem_evm1s5271